MSDEYFIVDDAIDSAGREGFELLFGDPHTAVGVSVAKSRTIRYLMEILDEKDPGIAKVARVFLARRHGLRARVVYINVQP